MLKQRVISALLGIPVIVAFLLLGKYFFALLVAVIVTVSLDELYSILTLRDFKPNVLLGTVGGVLLVAAALFGGTTGITATLTVLLVAALMWQVLRQTSVTDTALTLTGLLYVGVTLSHMILHYNLAYGLVGVLIVFIGTWVSDIAAYGLGSAIGKRKIAPSISANKTLEGLLAGIITPAIIVAILFLLPWLPFAQEQGMLLAFIIGLGMGLIIGVVAPIGDLVESRIKREMRVKDSGAIIPGHGGFLDRFDSLMLTSVAGYYFWLLVI